MCNQYADQLKRTAAEGHELICHTWSHPDLTKLSEEDREKQITDTLDVIRQHTGVECRGMRPPFGARNEAVDATCRRLGLYVLIWSMSTDDWDHNDADKSFEAVKKGACDGGVILCHDRSSTPRAVSLIVPWLRRQGYEVVTLGQMMEAKGYQALPGTVVTGI